MQLDTGTSRSDAATPEFRGGAGPVVAFLLSFGCYALVANRARAGLVGPDVSAALSILGTISGISVMGLVVWLLLRYEGLRPADVGLAPALALPAAVAVGCLWLGLNAAGVGLAAVADARPPVRYPSDLPVLVAAGLLVEQYLFVGLLEEFAFRGYLQTKLVSLFGGDDRTRTALGVGGASVAFAAMHVPNRLFVEGMATGDLAVNLALLAAAGSALGVVYEATRNVFLVGFLHGTGNLWLLSVDPRTWPTRLFVAWLVVVGVLLGATVWAYRRWADGPRAAPLGRPTGL